MVAIFLIEISFIAFVLGISFFFISWLAPDGDWFTAAVLLIGIIAANVPEAWNTSSNCHNLSCPHGVRMAVKVNFREI